LPTELFVSGPRILLVEDDPRIALAVVKGLESAGYGVEHCSDGPTGLARARAAGHDLLVLDLTLPGRSGLEILKAIQGTNPAPVIVITARPGLDPRLAAFELGADDVLPKPFWVDELVARIQRRLAPTRRARVVRWASAELDLDAHLLTVEGERMKLTTSEYNVLAYLVERPHRAVSRAQLLEGALPLDTDALERTVDSHVARIRKQLGASGEAIETVWRVGYRFSP
jgi:DNA-binding response OmpR family regulator